MGVCHVLLLLLLFTHFSEDQRYWHQVVRSVLFNVPCVEVACKGLFLIQKHNEEQGEALVFNHSQQCCGHMPHFRVYNYNFIPFSLITQICCCCTDVEFIPWCMVNPEKKFLWKSIKGVLWSFSRYKGMLL